MPNYTKYTISETSRFLTNFPCTIVYISKKSNIAHIHGLKLFRVFTTRNKYRLYHGLKEKPYTHSATPSLLRIRNILLQIFLARDKFFTAAGQSSSAAEIACPKYLKEFNISRGGA